jgi:hypothetical protein
MWHITRLSDTFQYVKWYAVVAYNQIKAFIVYWITNIMISMYMYLVMLYPINVLI